MARASCSFLLRFEQTLTLCATTLTGRGGVVVAANTPFRRYTTLASRDAPTLPAPMATDGVYPTGDSLRPALALRGAVPDLQG